MFIACCDLFKIGVGPSSSHTMGPMLAAYEFSRSVQNNLSFSVRFEKEARIRCTLFGSLAHTGKGHSTDQGVWLGLNGCTPEQLATTGIDQFMAKVSAHTPCIEVNGIEVFFDPQTDLIWNTSETNLPHPNVLGFELLFGDEAVLERRYISVGGGFIVEEDQYGVQPLQIKGKSEVKYPFDNASEMLVMANSSHLSIADMKRQNEYARYTSDGETDAASRLSKDISAIWLAMKTCVDRGLENKGELPGNLHVNRRAAEIYEDLKSAEEKPECHEWLSVYAMAVNEENAAGSMVVTAPTNGAAGVIPAVLYYYVHHVYQPEKNEQPLEALIEAFLLTAAAVGGLIKYNSSISGAEVGCQGEVGSAAAMAAAGLCALKGGSPEQIENAAEIALEHHLGMTCDPVAGLVQVPCIERNAFGAMKAWMAAGLALHGTGKHVMSLDACVKAMHETGLEMSSKFKETSLGGLAASWVEC